MSWTPKQIDRLIARYRREWQTPGFSVAVVRGDSVVYERYLGTANVRSGTSMNASSLISIASTTKAFTAAAACILESEHRLSLDAPIQTYLKDLKLHRSVQAERLTMRDLLTHRSGLPGHNLVWYKSGLSRDEMFAKLQYLPANMDLRQGWQYNNLMYMLAGIVIERVSGLSWEAFVRDRILHPLDMNDTGFFTPQLYNSRKTAVGHTMVGGQFRRRQPNQNPGVGPCGSIMSTVPDMTKWMMCNLDEGKHREETILPRSVVDECWKPQCLVPPPPELHEFSPPCYGLGWFTNIYRGAPLIYHTGAINDCATTIHLLPKQKFGVITFANTCDNIPNLGRVTAYRIIDGELGLPPVQWGRRIRSKPDSVRKRTIYKPRVECPGHAGDYTHAAYGTISIRSRNGNLEAIFRKKRVRLRPTDRQEYTADFLGPCRIRFRKNRTGTTTSLAANWGEVDIPFRRQRNE